MHSQPASLPVLTWIENEQSQQAYWRSSHAVPKRVVVVDDSLSAKMAYRFACEETGMLWRGDFQNARQLLQALGRRAEPKRRLRGQENTFHLHRQAQAQRARILNMLLLPFCADYVIPLRRAPDVRAACSEVYGEPTVAFLAPLRELLGWIGAHEWRKKGVFITALGGSIYPHYGVYSPIRGEYIDLIANTPLPSLKLAFDIGTGTGILAAILAKRGIAHVIATDIDERALICARENLAQLKVDQQVSLVKTDLFPEGFAPLIVCNPPWIPARPSSHIEQALYDPESRMLSGFLNGLVKHLDKGGEGWLILSDLAVHLNLRSHAELLAMITAAGLRVLEKIDIRPRHPKITNQNDPLHAARRVEQTSLWRLTHQ